jgi:hypothetical protein
MNLREIRRRGAEMNVAEARMNRKVIAQTTRHRLNRRYRPRPSMRLSRNGLLYRHAVRLSSI